ncbi:MAG: EAL domain-containing protein, partial [Rhodospirillaceae bacterium]
LLCASIGFLDPDRGIVTPAAVAGDMKEYANGLEVNLDPDAPTGGGAAARALRENKPCIANDFERSGMSEYWLARARRYGIRSTAAFPLHRGGKVYGGMCVYAGEIDFFDDELVQLLREMALDISLALDARERERKRREAEAKLRESEARYRLIVSNIPNGVVVLYDHDLRYQLVDGAGLRALNADPALLVGKRLDEVLPPDVASELAPHYRRALDGETGTLDISLLGRDWHVRFLPVQDRRGSTVAGMVIANDVTETKRAEEQLRLTGLAFGSIADGVMITDAEMRIVSVNKAFTTITGYTESEVVGKMPSILHSGKQDRRFYDALWQTIKRDGHWQGELWNRRKSGEVYPELLTISAVKNPSGDATHYVGVFNDMSTFKAYEERLEYLAHHDTLTGLPNRTLLEDRVEAAIGAAQRAGHRIALLFVDLDRFKLINDTLGHAIGDEMLVAVAKRLTACLRATDTVSRHGGDEFLILLPDLQRMDDAARIAEKVLEELSRRYSVGAHQLATSVSIGIAVYPENGTNMADLLRNADAAMYAAKELGRKRFQFYSDSMNARAVERLALETDLRIALEHEQLHLVYQPQFDLRTGMLIGIEALLRWEHPERGEIAPAAFIPVAEETGQIVALGEWALREACRQNKRWLVSGLINVPVSVNVSSIQFRQVDFAGVVAEILRDTELDARYLGLEVTESVLMGGVEAVSATLRELDAQGLKLAIDDFGIGYSSLSYLRHLPIRQLKIDASFVRDVPDSRDAMAIVEAIISMARSLDVLVVAEGVERRAQAEFLRRSACHAAQGFLYCRPLRPLEFEAWIASEPQPHIA